MKLFLVAIIGLLCSSLALSTHGAVLDQSFIDRLIQNITDPPGGGSGVFTQSNQPTLPGWETKYKSHIPRMARIGTDEYQISASHGADDEHYLEYVFALDQDGVLVFAKNITDSRASEVLETFTLQSSTATALTPYLTCNIHGIWSSDVIQLTALGVEQEATKIEKRTDPLTEEQRLAKTNAHVTSLSQIGPETMRIELPNHPVQAVDLTDEDNGHFIEAVWVRRVGGDNEVVYFRNVTDLDGQIDITFQVMNSLVNESFASPVRLQAFAWCNIHGLWWSNEETLVPPLYWEIASEFGRRPGNGVECSDEEGVTFNVGDGEASVHIGFDLGLAEQNKLLARFMLPQGMYLGLGLNAEFSMINTKAVVVRGPESANADAAMYNLKSRQDSQVVPTTNLMIRNFSLIDGTVEASVELDIASEQMDHLFVYAFGSLTPSKTLKEHVQKGKVEVNRGGSMEELTPRLVFELIDRRRNGTAECVPPLVATQCTGDTSQKRDVQVTHGVLMFIIWSFNITVGVFVARYERHTTWWLHVHKFLQLLCSITTIPVYVIGFISAESAEHFTTTHGKLGLLIAVISSIQVGSGVVMYMSAKLSRRLLHFLVAHPAIPADIGEALVLDFEKNPQGTILLQRQFVEDQDPAWLTLQRLQQYKSLDLSRIIRTFVEHHTFSQRFVYNYVVPFKKNIIIPMHRWLGRLLLIMVYVQMYLGVQLLKLDEFVVFCFYGWIAVLVLLLIYKEMVYQRKLQSACSATNGELSRKGKKSHGLCAGMCKSKSRRRRATTIEDEAMNYTMNFMRNKRGHEQEILSIHNFVGTPSCKRKMMAAEKKLSTDENMSNIIVDKDTEPQNTVGTVSASFDISVDHDSKDSDSKSTAASEEHLIGSNEAGHPTLSNV